MADDENTEEVFDVEGGSKTPEDLESEIAATASALGGKSKREKAVAAKPKQEEAETEEEPDEPEPEVEQDEEPADESKAEESEKPEEPEETEEPAEPEEAAPTEKPSSDEGERITVTTKKSIKPDPSPPAKEKQPEDEPAEDKQATMAHSGKTILPLSQQAKPETPKQAEPEAEADVTDDNPQKTEAAHKLDAITGELKARENEKQAEAVEQAQQTAKIYDTKKYHLPIKAGRHHRKSQMPTWMQVLVLLLALAGAAYYAVATDIVSFGDSSFLGNNSASAPEERPATYASKAGVSVIDLLDGHADIGSADALISVLYGNQPDSPVLTHEVKLEQNQAGSFWLLSDTQSLKTVNDALRDNNASGRQLATAQQTIDFLDIYGFSNLISDSSVGSLNGLLANLTGSAATACQGAIDSAIVAMSTDEFQQQGLEKFNQSTSSLTRQGQEIDVKIFSLKSSALDTARQVLEAAIEACSDEADVVENLKSSMWQDEDIRFAIGQSDNSQLIRIENTQIDRTVIDIELTNIAAEKTADSPDRMINFNSPVAKSIAAVQVCDGLAINIVAEGSTYQSLAPDADDYQVVVGDDVVLACSQDVVSNEAENLLRNANQLISLTSLVITYNSIEFGYPSAETIDGYATTVDGWLPSLSDSNLFSYSRLPSACGDETPCTDYELDLSQ